MPDAADEKTDEVVLAVFKDVNDGSTAGPLLAAGNPPCADANTDDEETEKTAAGAARCASALAETAVVAVNAPRKLGGASSTDVGVSWSHVLARAARRAAIVSYALFAAAIASSIITARSTSPSSAAAAAVAFASDDKDRSDDDAVLVMAMDR